MKKIFCTSFVALAALASVNASATVYNAGSIASNNTIQLLNIGFVGTGALSDTINFTLTSNASTASVAAAGFFIDNFTASLYDASNTLLGSGANFSSFNVGALTSGNYHLNVTGNVSAPFGGAYIAAITPAPEPETWAMMLAGLGFVASAARRKKNA
ncbi:MAG: FxDxF family PEP-CTERM protein [Pseudomonadota bacterium]